MQKEKITKELQCFVREYGRRRTARIQWRTPLVGFASAGDPLFAELKKVVSPTHDLPKDLLENAETVAAQRKLGRTVVEGDIGEEQTLRDAGIDDASILALTVPDEPAVFEATRLARSLKPGIFIVARTLYSSSGMQASQLGADEVIKAEQVVARQFYEMLLRKIGERAQRTSAD